VWYYLLGAINGTDFIDNPWNTTFKVFTDLLGAGFYLVPLSFIAVALYVKTRNPTTVSAFIWASGILMASGSIFMDYPEMAIAYSIFTAFGIVGVILSVFFMKK